MQTSTGAMAVFETDEDAKKAGYNRPLSKNEAAQIYPLSRRERRKWARAHPIPAEQQSAIQRKRHSQKLKDRANAKIALKTRRLKP